MVGPMRRLCPTLLAALLALPALACGPHGETGIPEGRDKAWTKMDHDERLEYMATVVSPRMKTVFQNFDPERFADFNCATCHGEGASGDFEMPNPELPELDASKLYKKHRKATPEITKLMWKEVEPTMGELLAQTYGFGGYVSCSSCHIVHNEKH